jgi:hypothetical protein
MESKGDKVRVCRQLTQDLLFGLDFYLVLGPSAETIEAESTVDNKENILYKCTV